MIKSMTAFSNSEAQIGSLTINCELRSVNHRYCDVSFKLPERLRFLDADLRRLITTAIKRGKVECSLNYKKHGGNQGSFDINENAVVALLKATTNIEDLMGSSPHFSALEILAFPGIQQEQELDKDALKSGVKALVNEAILKMIEAREIEGQKLKVLLEQRCEKISEQLQCAHQKMPEVISTLRQKMSERINELVAEPNFDRFEQEMVFMMQKLDVCEELERLEAHISEVKRVLQQQEPVGRRLDFLMQEMNREANTLGSKSADKVITQISIELKVLIEQMREQIQNIE
ncbi:MAG: YicC/YloC family endoribonuclease [Methylococcales bacterium]|nr:YicC/YloC family endoribonuclease [Methylococcales bacterium]